MNEFLPFMKKLAPEQMDTFVKRYQILKTIYVLQPVGRRGVSDYLQYSERTVRSETEKLYGQKLIEISKTGMTVTKNGIEVIHCLEEIVKELLGISVLEQKIEKCLGVKKVCIVQGDSDENKTIKKEMGSVAARLFLEIVKKDSVVAITGGSTMARFVEEMPVYASKKASMIVPARGSIGHKLEYQSNTLAATLAGKLGAAYKMLNIPDTISTKILNEIKNEPEIYDTLIRLRQADILVFGIGNALRMAKRRHVPEAIYDYLIRKEAVSEAFGYYFNASGEIVYASRSVSIKLEDILKIPYLIGVAGGANKGASILSVSKKFKNMILVLDEGAAHKLEYSLKK